MVLFILDIEKELKVKVQTRYRTKLGQNQEKIIMKLQKRISAHLRHIQFMLQYVLPVNQSIHYFIYTSPLRYASLDISLLSREMGSDFVYVYCIAKRSSAGLLFLCNSACSENDYAKVYILLVYSKVTSNA